MVVIGYIQTVIEIYKGMIPDLPIDGQRNDEQKQTDHDFRARI
jgi:hypothetical protein